MQKIFLFLLFIGLVCIGCQLQESNSSNTAEQAKTTPTIGNVEETANATDAQLAKTYIVVCCHESCEKRFRKRKEAQASWEEHHSEEHLAYIKDQDGKIIYLVDEKGMVQNWTQKKSLLYVEQNGCVTGSATECSY
jgi:hypothetical protein